MDFNPTHTKNVVNTVGAPFEGIPVSCHTTVPVCLKKGISSMSNKLLEIKDLCVNVEEKEILKGINLSVNKGEIHVIMGPIPAFIKRFDVNFPVLPPPF